MPVAKRLRAAFGHRASPSRSTTAITAGMLYRVGTETQEGFIVAAANHVAERPNHH
jgi:hypothetical protein